MPLAKDINTLNTETETQAAAAPAVAQPQAVATADAVDPSLFFANLTNRFESQIGVRFLPLEAVTSVSPESAGITVRTAADQNAGDFIIVQPKSISSYFKLDLGTQAVTEEEKKLQVCCWDGETVTLDEETISKNEYFELVKARGFSKASWKKRAVLYATYLDSDKPVTLSEDESLLAVFLSPSALRTWEGFIAKSILSPSNKQQLKINRVINKTNSGNAYPTATFERVAYEG